MDLRLTRIVLHVFSMMVKVGGGESRLPSPIVITHGRGIKAMDHVDEAIERWLEGRVMMVAIGTGSR